VIVWVMVRVRVLLTCCSCAHSPYIHSRNMQTPCRKRVDRRNRCEMPNNKTDDCLLRNTIICLLLHEFHTETAHYLTCLQ